MNYTPLSSLWDISRAPSQFSQLPDDDFLALLHKQFPSTDPNDHTVNPESVHNLRESPNSDDSSPSPPSNTDAASRRQSLHVRANDTEDAPLKRKASSDDMEPGPSSKNQHTGLSFPLPISTHPLIPRYQLTTTQTPPKSRSIRDVNRPVTLRSVPFRPPAHVSHRSHSKTNPVC